MDKLIFISQKAAPFLTQIPTSLNRSWIEISAQAFSSNITLIKQIIKETTLALVVKSNAYGHDIALIGALAQQHPLIDLLCTATVDEALVLRRSGVTKPIIALYDLGTNLSAALENNIQIGVYSYRMLNTITQLAQQQKMRATVHIKIDTGMGRVGIPSSDIKTLLTMLKAAAVAVAGIFTHLANKSEPDESFTHKQLRSFAQAAATFKNAGYTIPLIHALSSGALHLTTNYPFLTMARVGAHAYGLIYKDTDLERLPMTTKSTFTPILTWKTTIMQIKELPTGNSVGYAKTFITNRLTRIGILPLGYADGMPRSLSNNGTVLVNSQPAPIIGLISMNLMTIDLTDIPNANVGDEVTLMGPYQGITPVQRAVSTNSLALELTTCINHSISRSIRW